MEAWEQKKLEHREAKRAQHAEMLQPMVWQLVTLAERSITYCQSLDATAVPKSTWKDWAQAFVQGCLDDEEAAASEAAADEDSLTATQLITTPADKAAALVNTPQPDHFHNRAFADAGACSQDAHWVKLKKHICTRQHGYTQAACP